MIVEFDTNNSAAVTAVDLVCELHCLDKERGLSRNTFKKTICKVLVQMIRFCAISELA